MIAAERCTGTSPKQILWKINSALYSKQLGENRCSSVLHWILDEATELHATQHKDKTQNETEWLQQSDALERVQSKFCEK